MTMFTGIVRQIGTVRQVRSTAGGKRLTVDLGPLAEGLKLGDSVAVCGACLTVAALRQAQVEFDVIGETLARTTLDSLRAGARVNLERPLRLSDELHGHLVQGHVDGLAEVRAIQRGKEVRVTFAAPRELTAQMVPKGSVAVDGVSLTLAELGEGSFTVALIPTTCDETTLGALAVGDAVNVETDILGKYVLRHLGRLARTAPTGGITIEQLKQAGFE